MKLLTWNVQWCRGIDGKVDLRRIVDTACDIADFDVLCLQEVAVNFPGLAGSRGENQVRELSALLPSYEAHFGAATDVDDGKGGRSHFGNAIFSRLPVSQVYRHLLPWPVDLSAPSMQRIAIEAVVEAPWGAIRVVTTHLEYYSAVQRGVQLGALRSLHAEACAHARSPRPSGEAGSPFAANPRPASAIVTGDFNLNPHSAGYASMTGLFHDDTPRLFDAWRVAHHDTPHAPTVGIFENSFSDKPDCFDFIFLTPDLAARIDQVVVDCNTKASDHQPVLIELRN